MPTSPACLLCFIFLAELITACAAPVTSLPPSLPVTAPALPTLTARPPATVPAAVTPSATSILPTPTLLPDTTLSDSQATAAIAGSYDFAGHYPLLLLSDGSFLSPFGAGNYIVTADQIAFQNTTDSQCGTDLGHYTWSLQDGTLRFTRLQDPCGTRGIPLTHQPFKKLSSDQGPQIVSAFLATGDVDVNGVVVDRNGNLYFIDDGPNYTEYDVNGLLLKVTKAFAGATALAVDDSDNVYVSNFEEAAIHKFDVNGQEVVHWTVAGGEVGPVGMSVDAQGNLYVALHRIHDHYIEKYSPTGQLLGSWAPFGTGPGQISAGPRSGPGDVSVDAEGHTYIVDDLKRMNKYDIDGKFLYSISGAEAAVADRQGNVYILDKNRNLIKYDPEGAKIGAWDLPFKGYLNAVDPQGNVILSQGFIFVRVKLPTR